MNKSPFTTKKQHPRLHEFIGDIALNRNIIPSDIFKAYIYDPEGRLIHEFKRVDTNLFFDDAGSEIEVDLLQLYNGFFHYLSLGSKIQLDLTNWEEETERIIHHLMEKPKNIEVIDTRIEVLDPEDFTEFFNTSSEGLEINEIDPITQLINDDPEAIFKVTDRLIQEGNNFLDQGRIEIAAETYRKVIDIFDEYTKLKHDKKYKNLLFPNMTLTYDIYGRIKKFELIENISYGPTFKFLIQSLIKQKINYLRETKIQKKVERYYCIYCNLNFPQSIEKCTRCGKMLNSTRAMVMKEIMDDITQKFLNYDFLDELYDKDLENARDLLIYEKKFENIPLDFEFPELSDPMTINAIIKILQVTHTIKQLHHPEYLTHNSIIQIHNVLFKSEDQNGRKLDHSWGLSGYEETKFQEINFKNTSLLNETRKDILFSMTRKDILLHYKNTYIYFDYFFYFIELYHFINSDDNSKYIHLRNAKEKENEINFNEPKIASRDGNNWSTIQNKISTIWTTIRDGKCEFKIYLLETKKIEI